MANDIAIKASEVWKVFDADTEDVDLTNEREVAEIEDIEESVVAVRGVNFEVVSGETFIVMGLSGSGKSTLIRCLTRLLEPSDGTIEIEGVNVLELNESELIEFRRYKVGMVFQQYGLLPHRTVLDNVAFGLKIRGVGKKERHERAREVINTVGLSGWEMRHPALLSGGMRQRVGIARALVIDPPVMLMDEPFSGLDPLIRREMQDELVRLQESMHKTIFFVTHDLDEALRLGDHMAVMKAGEFVQVGTPTDILADPADEYVERFVRDKRRQLEAAESKKSTKSASKDVAIDKGGEKTDVS